MQPHVRTNEVEKEDESRDSGIGRDKGIETALDFVPRFELTVKRFDEIVRNIIRKALDANMVSFGEEAFDRDFVGGVTVADNGVRRTKLFCMVQDSMSLRGITVRREMKAENKAGFAVNDKPNVILFAFDFDNGFVSVPFVRVEIHGRNELNGDIIEERRKFLTPVSNSHMRHFDIIQHFENQRNSSRRIFSDERHG